MMNKKIFVGLVTVLLALSIGRVVEAQPDFLAADVTNPVTGETKNTVTIPSTAFGVAPNIVYLGTAIDKGEVVEGYAIIDYKEGFAKPPWAGGGKKETNNYAFLAKGAKWKTTEPYVLNTTNDDGLSEDSVSLVIATSFETWDTKVAFEIFGDRDTTKVVDGADTDSPDDKNEIFFGSIQNEGVIAVAIVWGIFGGPPRQRELVEYDVVFDDDYTWGDAGETSETELGDTNIMDLQNIATHEFGHAAGLDDLLESSCSEETMYGYAEPGETKKRTLNDGDIAGIIELYT
jgi:hypothetical protein